MEYTIIILLLVIIILIFLLNNLQKQLEDSRKAFFNISDKYRALKFDTHRLIWEIGNQREKVKSHLTKHLQEYHNYSDETAYEIAEKVNNNVYGR